MTFIVDILAVSLIAPSQYAKLVLHRIHCHLYPVMKDFHVDGCGLIHRAQEVTECFDEYGNYVNHKL